MKHMVNAEAILPPMPRPLRPLTWVVAKVFRAAVVAMLPRWQRELADLKQPVIIDAMVRPVVRLAIRAANAHPRVKLMTIGILSPGATPVVAPTLLGVKPRSDEVLSPAEAFARRGVPTPAELYAQLKSDQTRII
jgi:hypothetical protein